MTGPKISLIIPVYNTAKYLRECFDSICSSDYEDLEVLVVDDGSNDGSEDICDEYAEKDSRFTVYHIANEGLSHARNYALDRVSGEYIAFMDSDDWYFPGAIETMASYALEHDADVFCFRYTDDWVNVRDKYDLPKEKQLIYLKDDIVPALLNVERVWEFMWNKLYKKELFDGVRFPEGMIYEDLTTLYRVLEKAERMMCMPEFLYHYRKRRNSICDIFGYREIVQYWESHLKRYNDLIDKYPQCSFRLTERCFEAASRFWFYISECSAEEKAKAKPLMAEMKRFAKEHADVQDGMCAYSGTMKLLKLFNWSENPLFLRLLTVYNNHRYDQYRKVMYD